jgi:hypothetical protein
VREQDEEEYKRERMFEILKLRESSFFVTMDWEISEQTNTKLCIAKYYPAASIKE